MKLTVGAVGFDYLRLAICIVGMLMTDSQKLAVSKSNGNATSVLHVYGADFADWADVPHGVVASAYYRSSSLNRDRRMHVYTPPGYDLGTERYPVFYLLHGAGSADNSWTSIGRANFLLDNLIAAKKAKPMVVVMPMGHTSPFSWIIPTERPQDGGRGGNAGFEEEFLKDIKPYVESHYRVQTDRSGQAIAGFSMGGDQTLNIFGLRPKAFAYFGVFGSGVMLRNLAHWEKEHKDILADVEVKDGVRLLWFATGARDLVLGRAKESAALFKRNGFNPIFKESDGGHDWISWQDHLNQFVPQIFR